MEGVMLMEQSKLMAKLAFKALDDKMGEDIKVIDISSVSVMTDYFVIANGTNSNQVQALVDNVEEELGKHGFDLRQKEGHGLGNWVLLDFGGIIVHVFDRENRSFYDLERIWRDGRLMDVQQM